MINVLSKIIQDTEIENTELKTRLTELFMEYAQTSTILDGLVDYFQYQSNSLN